MAQERAPLEWGTVPDPAVETLSALVQAHDRDLRRLARAMTGDPALAAAAVTATWRAAWKRLSAAHQSVPRAWLLDGAAREARARLAAGVLARAVRRLRRPRPASAPWTGPTPPAADVRMAAAVADLSLDDRQMLALRYAASTTADEIAVQLGLAGAGVRAHLAALREQVCRQLGIPADGGTERPEQLLDRRLAERLTAHLDAGMARIPPADLVRAIRSTGQRGAWGRRTVAGLAVLAGLVGLIVLARSGWAPSAARTPSPGSLVAADGWTERRLQAGGEFLEVIGWAPDGRHVALFDTRGGRIEVLDMSGRAVRTVTGQKAAWVDDAHLLVLHQRGFIDPIHPPAVRLELVALDGNGDLLLDVGTATDLVAGGGGVAAVTASQVDEATGPRFAILREGAFSKPIDGLPLAWNANGRWLVFVARAVGISATIYRGDLHLLDAWTLTDHDLQVQALNSDPVAIDPSGRWVAACLTSPENPADCRLSLVDTQTREAQRSSIGPSRAACAWAADGTLIVGSGDGLFRWRPGDEIIATRWQPRAGDQVQSLARLGDAVVVALLHGAGTTRRVAGSEPPLVLLAGASLGRKLAGAPDGLHAVYAAVSGGQAELRLVSVAQSPAATPAPATSRPPLQLQGLRVLPADALASMPVGGTLVAGWGGHAYVRPLGDEQGRLLVVDPAAQTEMDVATPVATGEQIAPEGVVTDGSWLAVLVGRGDPAASMDARDCTGPPGTTLAWRILVAPVDARGRPGSFQGLANGVARRPYLAATGYEGQTNGGCRKARLPRLALDAAVLAYDVEAPAPTNAWASRIVEVRVDIRSPVRAVATRDPVASIATRDGALAWVEAADATRSAPRPVRVMVAAAGQASGSEVELGAGAFEGTDPLAVALTGDALAWGRASGSEVWRRPLVGGSPSRVSPNGYFCQLAGTSADQVAMSCVSQFADVQGIVLWSEAKGWRVLLDLAQAQPPATLGGGYLVIGDGNPWGGELVYSVPLRPTS